MKHCNNNMPFRRAETSGRISTLTADRIDGRMAFYRTADTLKEWHVVLFPDTMNGEEFLQ